MAASEPSATFYSKIRWLVVDTDNWLSEQNSFDPLRLGATDAGRRQFPVKLTMQQVEDSPDVDTDPPVSSGNRRAISIITRLGPLLG